MDGQQWRQKSSFYIRGAGTSSATAAATRAASSPNKNNPQTKKGASGFLQYLAPTAISPLSLMDFLLSKGKVEPSLAVASSTQHVQAHIHLSLQTLYLQAQSIPHLLSGTKITELRWHFPSLPPLYEASITFFWLESSLVEKDLQVLVDHKVHRSQ